MLSLLDREITDEAFIRQIKAKLAPEFAQKLIDWIPEVARLGQKDAIVLLVSKLTLAERLEFVQVFGGRVLS